MSLDLNKLANKLDKALSNETSETLNKFLTDKTMSNNKQSSVEWYSVKRDVLEIEVRLGKLSANEYAEELAKAERQAKAMHKEEIKDAQIDGSMNSTLVEYRIPHYYNETFGDESNN